MNNCTFTGRFAAAPRRQDTQTNSRCFFTLMVAKEGKKADGTKYPAQAVDFVAWGKIADLICQYKEKGHLVLINAEFATYEKTVLDMNNQPILNARKIPRAIFTVKNIEFMPTTNNGATNTSNTNNNASQFNDNKGELPFDIDMENDDPWGIGDLP